MAESYSGAVTLSVVSHGQGRLVEKLLNDLAALPQIAQVLITKNIPEDDIKIPGDLHERVRFINNDIPAGFAENHNKAFMYCNTELFCIMNPDIALPENPFPKLLECMLSVKADLVAPAVVNKDGVIEDSARNYPTLFGLFLKALSLSDGRVEYQIGDEPFQPDWVAGMFLLVNSKAFSRIAGFDKGFFLYYEDVDLCVRLRKSGLKLYLCPSASVIHDAQRESRRNVRYLKWHVMSMFRYFVKHFGRLPEDT